MRVRRLAPLDALFLAAETPVNRLHVMAIIILDPSTVPGGYCFERLRYHIGDRLHLVPPLRQRLVHVPLGLDLPVWVEESEVDVNFHVRQATLGARVDAAALAAFAAALDETPLDPTRPLWEMHIVEGLDDGHIAIVAKLHHTLMDGMAGMGFMASLFSFAPEAPEPPLRVPREVERPPGQLTLLAGALPSLTRLPRASGTRRAAARSQVWLGPDGCSQVGRARSPNPLAAPHTMFNDVASGRRAVAYTSLSFDDVRAVKQAFGVTVNDVVLAVVSGALRAYLAQRGALPDRALAAAVPVALRGDHGTDRANAVSLMFTSLATDVDDPEERLRAIHDATRAAKQLHQAIGPEFLPGLSGLAPPFALATIARLYGTRLVGRLPVACHALISNVAGPPVPMYFAGARVIALYPLGPLFPGIGLNVTVVSCEDSIGFGAVVCPDAVADVWDLVHGFADELGRLTKATRAASEGPGR